VHIQEGTNVTACNPVAIPTEKAILQNKIQYANSAIAYIKNPILLARTCSGNFVASPTERTSVNLLYLPAYSKKRCKMNVNRSIHPNIRKYKLNEHSNKEVRENA
jgi:hypothetical protein